MHVASIYAETGIGEYTAFPLGISENQGENYSTALNMTTAFVSIGNATYSAIHYNVYTSEIDKYVKSVTVTSYKTVYINGNPVCVPMKHTTSTVLETKNVSTSYIGNDTSLGISYINQTGSLHVVAGYLPFEVNGVLQHFIQKSTEANLQLNSSGTDSSYQKPTLWGYSQGYTNAASAYKTWKNALDVFSISLAEGLAITDALAALNAVDADTSEAAVIAETMDLVTASIGLASTLLDTYSTINFISGTNAVQFASGFTNVPFPPGNNYNFTSYQSSIQLKMTVNGNTHNFYAPEDYVNITGIA